MTGTGTHRDQEEQALTVVVLPAVIEPLFVVEPGSGRRASGPRLRADASCVGHAGGAVSGLGGLLISAATELPTGAMIVILSSLMVGAAALASRLAPPLRMLRFRLLKRTAESPVRDPAVFPSEPP